MDTQALVTNADSIEVGRTVTQAMLGDTEFQLCLSMWWRDVDSEEWRFVVSTPVYERWGAQKTYLRVRKILEENSLLENLMLETVWILPPSHPIIKGVGMLVSGKDIRVSRTTVNGYLIDDAYVFYSDTGVRSRGSKKPTSHKSGKTKGRREKSTRLR